MKKVVLTMMAAVACVLMIASCGDKVSTLKKAVEKAKADAGLPKTTNGVTNTDITFDEATKAVTYVYEIPAEAFAQMQAVAAQPNYKDVFIYTLKDNEAMKELAKMIVAVQGKLVFKYGTPGGSETIDLDYDSATLQKLVDGTLPAAQLQAPAQPAEGEAVEGEEMTDEAAAAEAPAEGAEEGAEEEVAE